MKKTQMLLIHPPVWNPDHPYTALPYLKGYAQKRGYHLEITDASLDFFDDIFTWEYLSLYVNKALTDFERMDSGEIPFDPKIFNQLRLISIYSDELRAIDSWKKVLRTDKNPETGKFIYHIFDAGLSALDYSYEMELWFNRLSSNKYNLLLIDDILKYVNDTGQNIFYDYYTKGNGHKLIEKAGKFQHVGFSVTVISQIVPALVLASVIKKEHQEVIVHFGGAYSTIFANLSNSDEILPKILTIPDFLVLNEGEITLEKIWEGADFHDCPNVVYLQDGKIVRTEKSIYIPQDPIVSNFDDLDLDRYFLPERVLSIVTARGCYNKCAFCSRTMVSFCNKYHGYNLEKLVECIHQMKEKYNVSCFTFNDEVLNLKRMVQFSKLLKKENITWSVETRMDEKLSDEEIQTIVDGGCRMLYFGMESYNQRVLDLMKKNISQENIEPLVNGFIQHGIPVTLFGLFGFPGETEDEMKNTMQYLRDVKKRMVNLGYYFGGSAFGSFMLLEGSDVYAHPKNYGVEILPKPSGSIITEHPYRYLDGRKRGTDAKMVDTLKVNHESNYLDFISHDYELFNPGKIETDVGIKDKMFISKRDLQGNARKFKYFYNYQLQLLVPVENPAFERALKSVYGHESGEPFDENAKFCLNPYVVVDDFVTDTIMKKKFRVDSVNISLLKKIESETEISGKDLAQSERDLLPRLHFSGFILQL